MINNNPELAAHGSKPNKIMRFAIDKNIDNNYEFYFFEKDKLKFYYYDLVNMWKKLNYKKIYSLYQEIFEADLQFFEEDFYSEENIIDINKYELFYILDIFNKDSINLDSLKLFYINNKTIQNFLSNTSDLEILKKFNVFLKNKIRDPDRILKIKQILGLTEKFQENKYIINKIDKIYQNYEIVYICIANGPHTQIQNFFVTEVINKKKTAVIYISEFTNEFPPFWLKKENMENYYVTENNMFDAFINVAELLTTELDVYIFEHRIPYKLEYFFDRLNCTISKKTLFYLGFNGCGHITSEHISTFLKNISMNKNVVFYQCGMPPKIPFFKDFTETIFLDSYPQVLKTKIVNFLLSSNKSITNHQQKYLKYKSKYLKLKKYKYA